MRRLVSRPEPFSRRRDSRSYPELPTTVTLLSRRALFARAALAAAAGAGAARLPAGGLSAPPAVLSPARRAAYAAMVAKAVAAEGGRAGPGYTERATGAFSGWYERNPNLRPMADHLIDGATRTGRRDGALAADARALASPPYAPDRA